VPGFRRLDGVHAPRDHRSPHGAARARRFPARHPAGGVCGRAEGHRRYGRGSRDVQDPGGGPGCGRPGRNPEGQRAVHRVRALKPENKEKLKEILLLHVVPGNVYAADVVKLSEAKTAGGKTVKISTDGGVKVGTATGLVNVVKTDIKAKNGVIHVIDAVILP
jgi:hypothetical protein